jgi:peptidoglycan/LPS O-acetylase OafA/YrhL
MRLDRVATGRDNNFDVLRLLAATLVLLSHAFPLTGRDEPFENLSGETLGGLGVAVFFAMSGFLVTKSWVGDPDLRRFARKRALRILPGLAVAALVTAVVIGPLVTTVPVGSYLTDPAVLLYVVATGLLTGSSGRLPGVFESNPEAAIVNGSLWTLPIEAVAYVGVAAAGLLGLLAARRPVAAIFLSLVAGTLILDAVVDGPFQDHGPAVLALYYTLRFGAYFAAGALLFLHRDRVELRGRVVVLLLAAWVVSWATPYAFAVAAVALPYAVLYAAFTPVRGLRALTRFGDVSYGTYIYAFPIQQSLVAAFGQDLGPAGLFALALPLTWLAGLVSWRLVEQPALRLKRRPPRDVAARAGDAGAQPGAAPSPGQTDASSEATRRS